MDIIIYVALKHYVYMWFIFIKFCLFKHAMYMRIVTIYTHRQKLSNSKLVLNMKKMFHTKILEI